MKSFINTRETVVTEAIDGLLLSSYGEKLARLDGFPQIKVVIRSDWKKDRVAVISGGGSGHEPAHAGFVGEGLLTAAVCGEIFASPSVDAILEAILAVTGDDGCLLIVKNYTGDRLNFGLAAEKAKALGFKVEMVIVSDDVALPDIPNPRGVAGTLFVHKIAGAKAASGGSLKEVYEAALDASKNIRSLGLALSNCNMPGVEGSHKKLAADKVELGLGIHGEPGANTLAFQSADKHVKLIADLIEQTIDPDDRVAVLINSLGGTSPLELSIVTQALRKTNLFDKAEFIIGPAPLMTAINMHGISLSVLILNSARRDALLYPTNVQAWPRPNPTSRVEAIILASPSLPVSPPTPSVDVAMRAFILAVTSSLQNHAADIDQLDAKVGDGDTGSTLALAASSIADNIDELPLTDGAALLKSIGDRLLRSAGGSSGVLLAILFTAAAQQFEKSQQWPDALFAGLEQMKHYGGAKLGDRTMIDALEPALMQLTTGHTLDEAAKAARNGADATASFLTAGAGRSAYVPAAALQGVPDPGAEAVARLLSDLSSHIETGHA
ncbi:dihydroxyacetone kinase subunit DhaK [Ochrobactrum soli]|uniref:DAK2 domain-containing protein n=1 Tax=Ochrobactrum soli TaxID=2448455 RepID=A0A849KRH0_9HYPH|nr:dihydroxyacetone kinase subunit DhaK [[Ochrobactrum] soli]NNU62863.1 DAK2 domain-containing protein [[Ochrobactrum] soli]